MALKEEELKSGMHNWLLREREKEREEERENDPDAVPSENIRAGIRQAWPDLGPDPMAKKNAPDSKERVIENIRYVSQYMSGGSCRSKDYALTEEEK